ncbi:MAG: hypothetical protein ACKOPG_02055 [Novosphingobium sp.]
MKFRQLIPVVAVACAASAATPGFAAKAANYTAVERHQILLTYAACVLGESREAALDLALEAERDTEKALSSKACAQRSAGAYFTKVRIPREVMVGALSEVLLAKLDLTGLDPLIASAPAPTPLRALAVEDFDPRRGAKRAEFVVDLPRLNEMRSFMSASACATHAEPAKVRAVFQAPFGSHEETGAISAIVPVLANCMQGGELRLRPDQLRLALATGYLRLARQADPTLRKKLI